MVCYCGYPNHTIIHYYRIIPTQGGGRCRQGWSNGFFKGPNSTQVQKSKPTFIICMLSVCYLYVIWMLSGCYLDVICMLSVCYLYVIWMLSVCYLYVICMLSVCYLYVICMLSVCYLYVICMLSVLVKSSDLVAVCNTYGDVD